MTLHTRGSGSWPQGCHIPGDSCLRVNVTQSGAACTLVPSRGCLIQKAGRGQTPKTTCRPWWEALLFQGNDRNRGKCVGRLSGSQQPMKKTIVEDSDKIHFHPLASRAAAELWPRPQYSHRSYQEKADGLGRLGRAAHNTVHSGGSDRHTLEEENLQFPDFLFSQVPEWRALPLWKYSWRP